MRRPHERLPRLVDALQRRRNDRVFLGDLPVHYLVYGVRYDSCGFKLCPKRE